MSTFSYTTEPESFTISQMCRLEEFFSIPLLVLAGWSLIHNKNILFISSQYANVHNEGICNFRTGSVECVLMLKDLWMKSLYQWGKVSTQTSLDSQGLCNA
jgi:hypothetical protein